MRVTKLTMKWALKDISMLNDEHLSFELYNVQYECEMCKSIGCLALNVADELLFYSIELKSGCSYRCGKPTQKYLMRNEEKRLQAL